MKRILIIDDETNIRMMLRIALEKKGFLVGQAADGPEGLTQFGTGEGWDAVLLDQRMPGMEGLDVLREMRKRDPQARVIIITAFGTIDLVVDAMRAGAKDFLRKPFTLETLFGAIDAALAVRSEEPIPQAEGSRFSMTTLNGFRIETVRSPIEKGKGQVRQMLSVLCPNGNTTVCEVALSPDVVAQIKQDAEMGTSGMDAGIWESLCEEILANHLWQDPEIPFGGVLHINDYSSSLRRWVLAAVTSQSPRPWSAQESA